MPFSDLTRAARWTSVGVVTAAVAAAASFALFTLRRPLDGVEGEILFEAQRIRAHLPLYVDPLVGAHEYGEPPSRYYVLYPPVWSATLALVPSVPVARLASLAAWWGALFGVAGVSTRERRLTALCAAAFVASFQTLMQFGSTMRPDAIAVALAGIAFARTVKRGRLDPASATLFALAAWAKPNVLGLGAGVLLVSLIEEARPTLRSLVAPIALSFAIGGLLHIESSGTWIEHLRRSTLQGWSLAQWLRFFPNRIPFLGSLIAAALAIAYSRRDLRMARLAGVGLLVSSAWMTVCMGKSGSQHNYWLEPTMGAVVILARVPFPRLGVRLEQLVAALACAQVLYTDVGSIRGSIEETRQWQDWRAELRNVRALVSAKPDELVVGSPGVEMDLDGRVVQTPFQTRHLVELGLLPVEPWIAQLTHPRVVGLVTGDALEEPVGPPLARSSAGDYDFPPQVRAILRQYFVLIATPNRDARIYARRGHAPP